MHSILGTQNFEISMIVEKVNGESITFSEALMNPNSEEFGKQTFALHPLVRIFGI